MYPKLADWRSRSTGPNDPIPTASSRSPASRRKNSATLFSVSLGEEVGKLATVRSPGPVPTAHMNLVPPASIQPKVLICGLESASVSQVVVNWKAELVQYSGGCPSGRVFHRRWTHSH